MIAAFDSWYNNLSLIAIGRSDESIFHTRVYSIPYMTLSYEKTTIEQFSAQGIATYQSVPSTSKMIPFNSTAFELGRLTGLRGMKHLVCFEISSLDRDMMLYLSRSLDKRTALINGMDIGIIAGR